MRERSVEKSKQVATPESSGRSKEPEKVAEDSAYGALAVLSRPGDQAARPPSPAGVLGLQRLAGNQATAALIGRRSGTRRVAVQRVTKEDVEAGNSVVGNTLSGLTNVGQITTAPGSDNVGGSVGQAGGGLAGALGSLTSGVSAVTAHKRRKEESEHYKKAKQGGKKDQMRARERRRDIAHGDFAQNTTQTVSGVGATVTGGLGVASAIGTVGTTAGSVAGVVGGAITAPLSAYTMIRQSVRAHKQRERVNRLAKNEKARKLSDDALNPSKLLSRHATSKDKLEEAKQHHAKTQETHDAIDRDYRVEQLQLVRLRELQKGATERRTQAFATFRADEGDAEQSQANLGSLQGIDAELGELSTMIETKEKTIAELSRQLEVARLDLDSSGQTLQSHTDTESEHKQDAEKQTDMQRESETSGHLNEAGTNEGMPTLDQISEYALKKNRRGHARRTLGAVAGAVGLVGGAVGIAGAVETLKGNAGLATNLGIGAAVVGGVAAAIGIGVGIWKAVSYFRKRKAQAQAIEKATPGTEIGFMDRYSPLRSKVSQSTQRKHYATALYVYATKGIESQRREAARILAALDPKGPWAKKDPATGELVGLQEAVGPTAQAEKDTIIAHFMDKMASGG
ncbi:MAG: hypothetical protein JWM85_3076 [Acidimicrobiaceae bacterium]|nr:hypothetical protein [Acidimicrobiaceae bacterium]